MLKNLFNKKIMVILSLLLILIILPISFAAESSDFADESFSLSLDVNSFLMSVSDLDFLNSLFTFENAASDAAPGGDGGSPPDMSGEDGSDGGAPGGDSQSSSVEAKGQVVVNDSQIYSGNTYSTSASDTSAILIKEAAKLVLSDATINKNGGDTSDTESSEFYGVNAGILVQNGELEISNTEINTAASGANALFATGENAKIKANDLTIKTTEDSSRGIDATYGASIEADNVKINTEGAHCAALATDRGEGSIQVTNSELNTNGEGSPSIYSTGNITVSSSSGLATASSSAVIEGKNSITLEDCTLESYAYGRTEKGIDSTAVMIYQSMSGDADNGTGTFTASSSTLKVNSGSSTYSTAPMFFITNTKAVINLDNVNLDYGSGKLLNVSSNDGEWGNAGVNGGDLTLTATNQELKGDIYVDDYSSLKLNLNSKSKLEGMINYNDTVGNVDIKLASDAEWTLTGDSYINSLSIGGNNLDNIYSNGYNIYYDGSDDVNSWLNDTEISLSDGGSLIPLN